MNDDTQIISPNWAPKLVEALVSNPFIPNFGVTGPTDSNNEKIFTHSFVHRTHMEVRLCHVRLKHKKEIFFILKSDLFYMYLGFWTFISSLFQELVVR